MREPRGESEVGDAVPGVQQRQVRQRKARGKSKEAE